MCGIVGFISITDDCLEYTKNKFFNEALFANTLRGDDATGMMTLKGDAIWGWTKQAIDGADFLKGEDFNKRSTRVWCAIGHNRSATIGAAMDTDNAHPFCHGEVGEEILLVHNGTLRSTSNLPFANKELVVDSDLVAYNLSMVSPEDATSQVIAQLIGAYALVWFDMRDQSVNLARNTERPLHLGIDSNQEILYISSDGHLMDFIGHRAQTESSCIKNIWQIGIHQHLKYKKGSLVPEVTPIVPFCQRVTNPQQRISNYTWRGQRQSTNERTSSRSPRVRPGARAAFNGRCLIAGHIRTIPVAHTKMLETWYGLSPREEYVFKPNTWEQYGHATLGVWYGKMYHEKWRCWLDSYVADGHITSKQNYPGSWTAVPIGIDHTNRYSTEDDPAELTVIMRLKYYACDSALYRPYTEDDLLSEPVNDVVVPKKVMGPVGLIPQASWNALTKHGCCECSRDLFLEEADEITWIGEYETQPLCMGCLASATTSPGQSFDYSNTEAE